MVNDIKAGYIFNEAERRFAYDKKKNYWFSYIQEMFEEMGISGKKMTERNFSLTGLEYLILGNENYLKYEAELTEFIRNGGVVVGFASEGLDSLFGIKTVGELRQPQDDFTITGYAQFEGNPPGFRLNLRGYLEPVCEDEGAYFNYRRAPLNIISDVKIFENLEGENKGIFLDPAMNKTNMHVMHERILGKGKSVYFSFNLPQTIWVMQQGRPVDRDYDGDTMYRWGDSICAGHKVDLEIPAASYWLSVFEEIFHTPHTPFIDKLSPSKDGKAADLIFSVGGDDENWGNIQIAASEYLKSKNLPYHFNLMPDINTGTFGLTKEEYDRIEKNGHHTSLHFNFASSYNHFTEEDFKAQLDMYIDAFGKVPVITVNHCAMATGWTEQARWSEKAGIRGDNSRTHIFTPPSLPNPINTLGFAFGTPYPYYCYEDYTDNNRKMEYIYYPMGFFEPRIYDETKEDDTAKIRRAIDRAALFGWTLNWFIHPVYISEESFNRKECRAAIDEIIRYTEEKGYRYNFYSTTDICNWWFSRSKTEIIQDKTEFRKYTVKTTDFGVLIRFCADSKEKEYTYKLDGEIFTAEIKKRAGIYWIMIALPQNGTYALELMW